VIFIFYLDRWSVCWFGVGKRNAMGWLLVAGFLIHRALHRTLESKLFVSADQVEQVIQVNVNVQV